MFRTTANIEILVIVGMAYDFFGHIVNLCCFFHFIEFFDYPPNSDIIGAPSQSRQGGNIQFEYYWVLCFSLSLLANVDRREKKKLYNQRFYNFVFNFIKPWERVALTD